jgi:hypothetical protein
LVVDACARGDLVVTRQDDHLRREPEPHEGGKLLH